MVDFFRYVVRARTLHADGKREIFHFTAVIVPLPAHDCYVESFVTEVERARLRGCMIPKDIIFFDSSFFCRRRAKTESVADKAYNIRGTGCIEGGRRAADSTSTLALGERSKS